MSVQNVRQHGSMVDEDPLVHLEEKRYENVTKKNSTSFVCNRKTDST